MTTNTWTNEATQKVVDYMARDKSSRQLATECIEETFKNAHTTEDRICELMSDFGGILRGLDADTILNANLIEVVEQCLRQPHYFDW